MNHNDLSELLAQADVADLDVLVDYITDSGKGRIALDKEVRERLEQCKGRGAYAAAERELIAHEIRTFGGNTLANLFREVRSKVVAGAEAAVSYEEVVQDVASHLKVPFHKEADVAVIEEGILRKILRESLEKMSAQDRDAVLKELRIKDLSMLGPAASAAALAAGRLGGSLVYQQALFVANAVAKALLGRGLSAGANIALQRTLGLLLGPVGWVITGVWTLADMASPAYRVTVPCVIQVAYIRQKALMQASSKECSACGTPNDRAAKFCGDCGQAFAAQG